MFAVADLLRDSAQTNQIAYYKSAVGICRYKIYFTVSKCKIVFQDLHKPIPAIILSSKPLKTIGNLVWLSSSVSEMANETNLDTSHSCMVISLWYDYVTPCTKHSTLY